MEDQKAPTISAIMAFYIMYPPFMEDQKQPTVSAVFVGSTLKRIRHLWRIKRITPPDSRHFVNYYK